MRFDPEKARLNRNKHGVAFSDAEQALYDPRSVTIEDPDSTGEQRLITLGMDSLGRLLVVVYSLERGDVRLISARKASPSEADHYNAR